MLKISFWLPAWGFKFKGLRSFDIFGCMFVISGFFGWRDGSGVCGLGPKHQACGLVFRV